jgi:hypothetical protein
VLDAAHKYFFNENFQSIADDARAEGCADDLEEKPFGLGGGGKIIALPATPEINDHGEHCAGMQHNEQHCHFGTRRIQSHEFFYHDDVCGTGHGQQFTRALDECENQNLKPAQHNDEVCPKDLQITMLGRMQNVEA